MRPGIHEACNAEVLDADNPVERRRMESLQADPRVEVIDRVAEQTASLQRLRPCAPTDLIDEQKRWAYYPWRRSLVAILGPRGFRAVRLDRNRNLITAEEQQRLGRLRIGVIGLSVGHVIAHTLAAQGLCGELRLADFDGLDLTNLNRVPASVFDLGVNKAVAAARRIVEVDPYLRVTVEHGGVTPDTIDAFLEGLDIVVEECDSLDVKVLVRESARARRLPVLMATSDRGLIDIERFDLEPSREILHGLLGDVDAAGLAGLSNRDKIPHVLRVLDGGKLSARGAASLVEVGQTLSTWPQLAGDVTLGAVLVAEAVRRIGLGEALPSGRVRVEVGAALDGVCSPDRSGGVGAGGAAGGRVDVVDVGAVDVAAADVGAADVGAVGVVCAVAAAAVRAPSGGNSQPWRIETQDDSVTVRLAPEHTSTMDVGFRASAVAVGAAAFNARVAAAAHGRLAIACFAAGDEGSPLHALVRLGHGEDPELAGMYQPMLLRETNRHLGSPGGIDAETIRALEMAVARESARVHLLTNADQIAEAARLLGAADRIRYLTPRLHADMAGELRWPGEPGADTGIDVRSLELDPATLVILELLRRPDVMAELATWNAGEALRADTRARVSASSALAVVSVRGHTLVDYARGGSAVEAAWILAQQSGLAVQPISPPFLYAHGDEDLRELSPPFAGELAALQSAFRTLAGARPDESQVLVLRLSHAPPPSVRSRRRTIDAAGAPAGR
ncbi:MAG: Rv1355c family protein [Mycobacteriaceae bacterium]|nr:Rv1355c family protein [Mycobacteriaceae bacterium]